MKSLSEICINLDTDKIDSQGYLQNYERHLEPIRTSAVRLLELGVANGGSLRLWQEYFPKGQIIGLDKKKNPFSELPERTSFYRGRQDDYQLLENISKRHAPNGFNIIVDDGSHIGLITKRSFEFLFYNHLASGGLYVIEDWGTGYWGHWPDGRFFEETGRLNIPQKIIYRLLLNVFPKRLTDPNFGAHNFGMVGFVKELVDKVAWPDITHSKYGNSQLFTQPEQIASLTIYSGHLFITKA